MLEYLRVDVFIVQQLQGKRTNIIMCIYIYSSKLVKKLDQIPFLLKNVVASSRSIFGVITNSDLFLP